MTIELALSGLSLSLFCVVITLLLIGLSITICTAVIFFFVKGMNYMLSRMKGGFEDLKENVKAMA